MSPKTLSPAPATVPALPSISGTVAAYLRCSTPHQRADLDHQRRSVLRAGYEPAKWFEDVAVSGSQMERAGLTEALAWLREGDTLVVCELSRLGRGTVATLDLLRRLDDAGVRVVSLREQMDTTTAMGRAMIQISLVFSELERELAVERTRSGLEAARARGARLGRPPALTAEQTAEAQRLVSEGVSLRQVARLLSCSKSTIHRATRPNQARDGGSVD